jgi:hypothetical protein
MLHERAMLVKLHISQWNGRKKDKRITKETNAFYGAAKSSGYYSKSLIEKEAVKAIQQAVNTTRKFHYENTLPWGDNGERLLPSKNYLDYTRQIREHNALFDNQVKKFLDVYPSLITEAEYKLNKMFNRADYPDVHQIQQRFSFATEITPVPSGADFRVDLAQDEVNAIQHQIEKQTRQAQADAMNDLWNRLYDVVHKMAGKLGEKDVIFRDSLVGNIKDLTDLLPNLNVTDDPDLERLRKEVASKLCKHTPGILRHDKNIKAEIAYDANAILESMGNYMGKHPAMEAA